MFKSSHVPQCPEERNADLSAMYRSYFRRHVNAGNLAMLVDSFARRTDLNITRHAGTLRPPVLNLAGALSPHLEQTVTLNSRLHPSNSTWMKVGHFTFTHTGTDTHTDTHTQPYTHTHSHIETHTQSQSAPHFFLSLVCIY